MTRFTKPIRTRIPAIPKRKRRRATAASLAILATTTLAACGQAPSKSKSSTASASSSGKSQHVNLTFLNTGASPQVISYFDQTVIPQFEKVHPNITVQMSTVAWGSAFTKIETGVVSGLSDDVFLMGNIFLPVLVSKHGLYPLTHFMKGWAVAKQLNQPALQAGAWDGVQYAVPVNLDVRGLLYNEAMLKQAGITSPPRTWTEYKADAARLVKKRGGRVTREGVDWAVDNSVGLAQTFNLLLDEAGGSLFKNGPNGTATFTADSPAGEKALSYLQSFYKDGLSSTSFVDVGTAPTPLALGEAAMEMNNAGSFSEAPPSIARELRMTRPLAATSNSRPVGMEFVNKLGIYARTKHPKSAWDFVSYLYTPSVLSRWDQLLGEAPPEVSLASQAPWSSGVFHAMVDNEKFAQVFPVELQSTIIDEDLTRIVDDVIYQKVSVPAALSEMKAQITPLLKG